MRRSKYSARRLVAFGIIGILFFVLIWAQWLPADFGFTAISGRSLLPWFSSFRRATVATLTAPWKIKEVEQELSAVRNIEQQAAQNSVRLLELERENRVLRRELDFKEENRYPLVTARVLAKTAEGGGEFFILNRGAREGLTDGQPVVIGGALVGKIIKTSPGSAVVTPLSNVGIKTAATFAGKELTVGVVEGEANATLNMKLIPKDITVTPALAVITSGLEPSIPRGLLIGKIIEVSMPTQELFQNAYLQPPSSLQEGTIVSVIVRTVPTVGN